MKCSIDNRYERTAQLLFMISGLAFLFAHLYELVILPVVYAGWGVLERYPRYIVESIDNGIRMLSPILRGGLFFLMAWAIRKRKRDLFTVGAALLCIDGVLRIVAWWHFGVTYKLGTICNLVALLLFCAALGVKQEKAGRMLLIPAMTLFSMAAVPEGIETCFFLSHRDIPLAMRETAWVIEAIVFVFFGYCQLKKKIRWEAKEKRPVPAAAASEQSLEWIIRLKELKDKGILTQEEFDAKKKEILERST